MPFRSAVQISSQLPLSTLQSLVNTVKNYIYTTENSQTFYSLFNSAEYRVSLISFLHSTKAPERLSEGRTITRVLLAGGNMRYSVVFIVIKILGLSTMKISH